VAGFDLPEQLLKGRPLQRPSRKSSVVEMLAQSNPAFRFLAGDIGLAGLALRIETVEILFETFVAVETFPSLSWQAWKGLVGS
jgi:hypothetical protein